MILHVFTEEKSAEVLLDVLLKKLLLNEISYRIYIHQGKQDLERSLKKCLPTISRIPNSRVLIIRDQDS